jgi:acetyl esterase
VVNLVPQAEALRLERLAAGVRPLHELSVAEARDAEESQLVHAATEHVADVSELELPGSLSVRLYRPDAARPLPALVFFFGGGWVIGSLESADSVCRRLANAVSCAVFSVAYRRAPEHRFPAAVEDCYAATCWASEHGAGLGLDPARLAIGGASSGGNLAAAVTQLARDRGGPPLVFQLLVYPPVDHGAATPSRRERPAPPFFGPEDLDWCWSHYLADPADGESPLASPLRAADLAGLPPALVVTAEIDPIRDEAELYAGRLRDAGVPAEAARFAGVPHGFFSLADRLDAAVEAQARAASALRAAFSRTS